jgi:hypothetical protein
MNVAHEVASYRRSCVRKKGPDVAGPLLFLIAVVNDRLTASPVIVVLLDNGSTFGRLTLFDNGSAVPIPVAVVIPMALADGHPGPDGANANADIIRQRGRSERRDGGNYQ